MGLPVRQNSIVAGHVALLAGTARHPCLRVVCSVQNTRLNILQPNRLWCK